MVPNMVGIIILAPKVKKELQKYFSAIKQSWPLLITHSN
jgi:Na+/alanine symporter